MANGRAIGRFEAALGVVGLLALGVTYSVATHRNPLPAVQGWLDRSQTLAEPAPAWTVRTGDQPEVVFRAAHPSSREAVFENPAHDYPKRIGYRLVSPDSLDAWVDGGAESKAPKISYGYHRVDCAGR